MPGMIEQRKGKKATDSLRADAARLVDEIMAQDRLSVAIWTASMRDFLWGVIDQYDHITCLEASIAEANAENARLREALDGYRAATAFIAADAWDGCSDCINVLRAARAADYTKEANANETALHLARIRKHYSPALEAPSHD